MNVAKIHSFDIFDTLFTRRTAEPIGIFKIMQYKLIKDQNCPSQISDNFVLLRIECELYARRNLYQHKWAEDVTLDEIYNFMQSSYGLSDYVIDKIKSLEIKLEIDNVVPLYENIELFKKIKSKDNSSVILVSDMYLPESVIRKMLLKADPCFKDVKIYLSCECNHKTKHYGSLYDYVKKQENIDSSKWYHYGDNPHADVYRANEKGIKSNILPQINIGNLGHYLINRAPYDCIIDAIVGASRLSQTKNASASYKLGSCVTGPLLYSYVRWVLDDALAKKYKNLYFVARDGYILKIIADEIINREHYDIKSHYLYASRQAWRIINSDNYESMIDYFFSGYDGNIDEKILAQKLCIEINDLKKYFGSDYNNFKNKKKYIDKLKKNLKFRSYVLSVHQEKEKLLIKYMQQECGKNPDKIVLVDLDGSGLTQDCLQLAISSKINSVIHCYYFFQFYNAQNKEKSIKQSYFLTVSKFNNWIEVLTRNCDGQTIAYKEEKGKIIPILYDFPKQLMQTWGYNDYIAGIKNYVNNIISFEDVNNIQVQTYLFYILLDDYLHTIDDYELAEVLGSIIYSDYGGDEYEQIAPPLTFKDCLAMLFCKKNVSQGILAKIRSNRSNFLYKIIYDFCLKYHRIRKSLISIRFSAKKETFQVTLFGKNFDFKKAARLTKKLIGK